MITPNVQELCGRLWDLRETGCFPPGHEITRQMYLTAADDVLLNPGYDPEADKRLDWLRAVAKARTDFPRQRADASEVLEDFTAWLLGRERPRPACGKSLAAGENSYSSLKTENFQLATQQP